VASEAAIMTIFNASDDPRTLGYYKDQSWTLHPVLAASSDPVVQTAKHDASGFFVPARTTAVFVRTAPAQTSCAPYSRDLFVRGVDGDWTANPVRELGFLGGTSYSVTLPIANVGEQAFKIADADWNGSTNCGGAEAGQVVELGVPAQIACFNDSQNLGLNVPAAGDYTFELEAADTANPTLTVSKAPPFDGALFVRGVNGDWTTANPMTFDGVDRYTALLPNVTVGDQQFKIADADWTGATNCGGAQSGQVVELGVPAPIACFSDSQNLSLTVVEAGSYFFSMDVTDPGAPALTVEKLPIDAALFLRGLNGDWSDAVGNQMDFIGGGTYRARKLLNTGGQEFKVADSGWTSGTDCGAAGPLQIGEPLVLNCAGGPNIPFTVVDPGTYEFSLDASNAAAPALTVTGP
jgi:pullulanase